MTVIESVVEYYFCEHRSALVKNRQTAANKINEHLKAEKPMMLLIA
jgi:hypothetical protein